MFSRRVDIAGERSRLEAALAALPAPAGRRFTNAELETLRLREVERIRIAAGWLVGAATLRGREAFAGCELARMRERRTDASRRLRELDRLERLRSNTDQRRAERAREKAA